MCMYREGRSKQGSWFRLGTKLFSLLWKGKITSRGSTLPTMLPLACTPNPTTFLADLSHLLPGMNLSFTSNPVRDAGTSSQDIAISCYRSTYSTHHDSSKNLTTTTKKKATYNWTVLVSWPNSSSLEQAIRFHTQVLPLPYTRTPNLVVLQPLLLTQRSYPHLYPPLHLHQCLLLEAFSPGTWNKPS